MKVVLDTNVLIAALIAEGVCATALEHCVQQHTLVTSEGILNELDGHLVGKFKYDRQEANEAVQLLQSQMTIVIPAVLSAPVCRDADDDMILGTAVAGNVQCIVTGDKDLLVLGRFQGIDILRPADFAEYEARQS